MTKQDDNAEQVAPTDIEVQIAKFERRLADKKHIDAKDLGIGFIFPLLRKLAKGQGDLEEQVADVIERLESDADMVSILEAARDAIFKLSSLLDQSMVAAGFYIVENNALKATDKVPAELRGAYEAIGREVQPVVVDIQAAIEDIENGEEDEDPEDAALNLAAVPNLDAEDATPEVVAATSEALAEAAKDIIEGGNNAA